MATITSNASGNWSAGGTWIGGVAPTSTDDVVIGAHTITLDSATITCNSLNFNHTSARVLCPAASTRELIATNGFSISSSVNLGAVLSGGIVSGQDMTFTGTWAIAGSMSSFSAGTGGTLTIRTAGAVQSNNLFTLTNAAASLIITSSWSGGTLNTYGLINFSSWTGTNTLVTMSAGAWNHYSSGTNYFGTGAMRVCALSGTAALTWTGNTDESSALSSQGVFHFTSTANQSLTGDHLNKNASSAINQNTSIIYAGGSGSTITLTGCLCARGRGLCIYTPAASTINWRNQSLSVASTDQIHVEMYGGSIDISGLIISNAGKVDFTIIGSGTLTADTNTSITNTSSSATASCIGSTSLDGKIVTVPNPAPTLPAVGYVTAGQVYGYAATPLTGTGLILDPSTLATALTSTLNNISATALARFVTVDTGQTSAATGSVAALCGGGGLTASAIWSHGTRTLTALGFALGSSDFAANSLTASAAATDLIQEIRDAITGGAYALSTDANGRIRIVDGTGAGELDTSSGGVLVFDFTTAAKALLQTEAEDALVVHRLDELLNADSDIDGLAPPTVGSVFHELMTKTPGSFTYDQTSDSLEALRDNIPSDVWSSGTRTLTALGFTLGASDLAVDTITAAKLATDAVNEIRNAITGGAYALSTDANGMVRIVDGTGSGEIATTGGAIDTVTTVTNQMTAAQLRSNLGLASANLDSQLDALPTASENATALLDLTDGIETSITLRKAMRALCAVISGTIDDAGTNTETFKGIGVATTRVVATVDSSGNRSAIVLSL